MPYLVEKYNQNQSLAARNCLKSLLTKYNIPLKKDLPQIIDHIYLKNFPSIKVSLSHTRGYVAASFENSSKILSIGIDIEIFSRPVKPGIEKFFVNSEDDSKYSLLELWTLKEAAFKALSPLLKDEKLTLKKIWINKNQFGLKNHVYGHIKKEYLKFKEEKLIASKAVAFEMPR